MVDQQPNPSGLHGAHVLNFGSLNIDRVFRVPRIAAPGQTLVGRAMEVFAGGKGANQSVALARAGVAVLHCGKVGCDGEWLIEKLNGEGIDTRFVQRDGSLTGQAFIQVEDTGQNAIVLHPGANHEITPAEIDAALESCPVGSLVLTQNETSCVPYLIEQAAARGMTVVFNPAPFTTEVLDYPLDKVDLLIANESEWEGFTGQPVHSAVPMNLHNLVPAKSVLLTLGAAGAVYEGEEGRFHVTAFPATVVDTTAAGDTFVGYFFAGRLRGATIEASLATAAAAAAMYVSRRGAIDSIPHRDEISRDASPVARTAPSS